MIGGIVANKLLHLKYLICRHSTINASSGEPTPGTTGEVL